MNKNLSKRVDEITTSATLAMAAKARELKEAGKDIISLTLGEPDFAIPEYIKEAAIQAIEEDYHSYSPVDGFPELKQAIITKFKRDNDLSYTPAQIVVSTGAKQALANVAMALLNNGDEVILPSPYWVSYSDMTQLFGGVPVAIPSSLETDFKITPKQLEAAITPKTKMVLFSSPCNPSGSVYSKKELRALADILVKYPDIIVVSDEIYEHINFVGPHVSIAQFEDMYERTVVINGVSKAFSMTGWRIGYLAGPEWLASACNKLQGQITSGANVIAQQASISALENSPSKIQYMVDAFKERRKLILELLSDIPGFSCNAPQGAFYVFPDISFYIGKEIKGVKINSASDLSLYLLEHANVATVTGEAFGAPNCIRMSYATSNEEIIEAMHRIKEAVS